MTKKHKWIANQISGYLNLSKRDASLLGEGSILPDRVSNFPHHNGKKDEIIENVIEARKRFLENDDECYYRLGFVLHYLQDSWTLNPRVKDKHTLWEKDIHSSTSQITDYYQIVKIYPTESSSAISGICLRARGYAGMLDR